MSGPERPETPAATTRLLKRKNFSKDEQDDLDELDRVFKRIKAVVPRVPYILSTPSLDPYRYHSQQEANAWMMGHLWRPNEQHLQHQTYVYREPCQDCLELQAGEDDDPEPQRPESRASNPGGQVPKKKLNLSGLSGFKIKPANGPATPGSKRLSPTLPPITPVQEHVNGVNKTEKETAHDPKQELGSSEKPSIDACDERQAAKATNDHPRSEPRPRSSSPSRKTAPADFKVDIDKSGHSDGTPHGLPPLLSPVHEPPSNPYGLPDILSPTLPSNIQAELERLETQRKRAESNASTSSSDRKSQTLAVPDARSQKPVGAIKSEPRIRSVSMNQRPPNTVAAKRTEDSDPSLVVKLKFSKAKAPTVGQILRLPPKRKSVEKKERLDTPVTSQPKESGEEPKKKKPIPKVAARRSDNTTPVSTPNAKPTTAGVSSTKLPEKRPRADEDATLSVPSKRPRAASLQDRPITPVQQGISSPALSNKSSAQKVQAQYTTPKNNHKTISMLRTNSAESNDSTPGRSVATPSVKLEGKTGPTSAPTSANKQAEVALLAQTSMKLNQMGRALKHEATKILTANGQKITKQDEKRAAVTNMECILSYMAAYYAQDASLQLRGRPSDVEHTWRTLLPLCLSYARSTKDFRHLDGLRSYLSLVTASAICMHVSQRPSVSQDIPHADLAKQNAMLAANFALISDHTKQANQHHQDARTALPMEEIRTVYQKTFAAQEMNARLAKVQEIASGAHMSGPYFLPIGNDTTPIQAVRFGLKFLAEYCEKEKLDYSLRLRLNLDKTE